MAKKQKSNRQLAKKRSSRRTTKKRPTQAKARRPKARAATKRRDTTVAKRKTTKRRAPARRRGGLVNTDLVLSAVKVTGSAMLTQYAANYVARKWEFARSPGGSIATKAGIALAGGMVLKKFGGSKHSRDFMLGALGVVAGDAIAMVRGSGGGQLSGYTPASYGQGMGELRPMPRQMSLPERSGYGEQTGGRRRVTAFGAMN